MTRLTENSGLGTPSVFSETSRQQSRCNPQHSQHQPSAQDACRELQREFIIKCLRISGLECNRAANDFANAFDSRARISLNSAVLNLQEATSVLVEMSRLL